MSAFKVALRPAALPYSTKLFSRKLLPIESATKFILNHWFPKGMSSLFTTVPFGTLFKDRAGLGHLSISPFSPSPFYAHRPRSKNW